MKLFEVHIIPHDEQRYDTVGDWVVGDPPGGIPHRVYVSHLPDRDAEFLVALHELMEFWVCQQRSIPQSLVDEWDQRWEPSAENQNEPGCEAEAPYHWAHEAGETLERVACHLLWKDWHTYERVFESLETARISDKT